MSRQSFQPAALLLLATVVLLGLPAASAADYRPAARKLMAGTCSPAVAKFENTYSLDIVTQLQGLQLTPDQCCGACYDKGFAYWQMTEVLPNTGLVGGLVGGLLNGVGNVVNGLLGGQQQQSALIATCSCLKTVLLTTDLLSNLGLVGSKIGETGRPIDSPLPLPDPVPSPSPVASPGSCTGTPTSSNQLSVSAVIALKGIGVSAQQCCGSCGQAGYPAWQLVQLVPGLGNALGGLSLCGCVSQSSDLAVVDTSLLSNAGLTSVQTGSTGVPAGSAPTGLLAGLPDLSTLLPSLTGILSGTTGSLPVVGGLLNSSPNPAGGLVNNPVGGLVNGVVMTVRNLLGVLGTDCSALPLDSITSTVENLLKSLLPNLNLPLGAVSTTCTKVPGTSGLLQLTQQIKTDSQQSAKDIVSALTGALQNGQLTGLLGGLLGSGNTLLPVNNLLNKVTSLVPCVVELDVQCVLNTVLSATDILNNIPLLNLNLNNGGTGGGLNLPIVGNLLGGSGSGGLLGGLLGNGGALNLLSGNGLLNLNGLLGGVLGGGNNGGLLGGLLGGSNGGLLGGLLGGGNNGGLLGGLLGGGSNGGLPILGGLNLNILGGLLNGGSATGSGLGGLLSGVLGGGNSGGLLGGLLGKNGLLSIVPNLVNGLGVKLGNGQTLPAGGVLNILSKDRKSSLTIMSAKQGKSVTIKANSPKTGPITIIATPAHATVNGKKVTGMALKTIINKPGKLAHQKGLFARAAKMAASGKNGGKRAIIKWGI